MRASLEGRHERVTYHKVHAMVLRLNGWQRLWILAGAVYAVWVVAFVWSDFQDTTVRSHERALGQLNLRTDERLRPQVEQEFRQEASVYVPGVGAVTWEEADRLLDESSRPTPTDDGVGSPLLDRTDAERQRWEEAVRQAMRATVNEASRQQAIPSRLTSIRSEDTQHQNELRELEEQFRVVRRELLVGFYVPMALLYWAVPMVGVYVLGWLTARSAAWVIRGFRSP